MPVEMTRRRRKPAPAEPPLTDEEREADCAAREWLALLLKAPRIDGRTLEPRPQAAEVTDQKQRG